MRKSFLFTTLFLAAASMACAEGTGIVNFGTCLTDSKQGKKEQESLDNLRSQMSALMENTEKELKEISTKFEDTEYLDSLSPKAEEELKLKYQSLQEDLARYQNQFYQMLNHANYQMFQKVSAAVASAAEAVAKKENLDYVINKEACFYTRPDLDCTDAIIEQMDRNFDLKGDKLSDNAEGFDAPQEMLLDQAG